MPNKNVQHMFVQTVNVCTLVQQCTHTGTCMYTVQGVPIFTLQQCCTSSCTVLKYFTWMSEVKKTQQYSKDHNCTKSTSCTCMYTEWALYAGIV